MTTAGGCTSCPRLTSFIRVPDRNEHKSYTGNLFNRQNILFRVEVPIEFTTVGYEIFSLLFVRSSIISLTNIRKADRVSATDGKLLAPSAWPPGFVSVKHVIFFFFLDFGVFEFVFSPRHNFVRVARGEIPRERPSPNGSGVERPWNAGAVTVLA